MNKTDARLLFKAKRNQISQDEIENQSLQIANRLLELSIWDFEYYHIYLPIHKFKEVDTSFLLHILQGKDKHVIISKSDFSDYSMQHFLLTDATKIIVNKFGIPEPEKGIAISEEKLDVVFIPLLAADLNGNRVGYGKGFYDRFLEKCRPDVLKVGLSFFDPLEKLTETNSTDISLDFLVTSQHIYDFKRDKNA